jgi:hypothetical protein
MRDRRFRASRDFTLASFDELGPDEQGLLQSLTEDPNFYGVLRSTNPLLPAKSVSKEAALVFLTLQRPQRIPVLLSSIFGEDVRPLQGLLADGVLEVEHEGSFVSGAEALRLFSTPAPSPTHATHPTAALSRAAIEFAASYDGLDAIRLSDKVYAFGRQPCTEATRRRFAHDRDLLSFLLLEPKVGDLLASRWESDDPGEGPWLSWSSRRASSRLGYKLYVSAREVAMPRLFAMAVRAMRRSECQHFKIGRRGEGVCRPDKMVAYFGSLDALRECASLLESELRASDVPATHCQGVPFSAAIDDTGFLSWGHDPPSLGQVTVEFQRQSWRQWIASRVAVAVLSAKETVRPDNLVAFVLQRIQLDGVDTSTWAPKQSMWREYAARPEDVV